MLLAGPMERSLRTVVRHVSPFLRVHSFILLPGATKEGEGARLAPSLESCLWQVFVYLFKFLHTTEERREERAL